MKGYFSKTTAGEASGEGVGDFVIDQDQDELRRHGFDENGHDEHVLAPSVVVFPRSTEDVVEIVKVRVSLRSLL